MPEQIQQKLIEEEMKQSYIDYAMSVITARALPDVRDGLKPVHRRILYAMYGMGLLNNKPFVKSARIVGECFKYHPHGDASIYDSLVRMAQDFSLRYPLVKGHGNFGSIDGFKQAQMRYCVSGDSFIVTEKGLERIDNISDKENTKLKILSKDKKINYASKWFDSGEHETIKITTNKGYSLTGSKNHPILTLTKDEFGKPIFMWKLLENIKEDDIVVIDRKEDNFWPDEETKLEKFYPIIKKGHQHKRILPKRLDKNLSFILGLIVSEGSITNNKLEFCNVNEQLIEEFEYKWKKVFPDSKLHKFKKKPSSYGKKDYFRLECHCRYTLEFLRNIGLKAVKSEERKIPFLVLQSPKYIVTQFLKAYFEGDGSISYSKNMRELSCCSKSEELLKELQILFLRFGIDTFRRFDKYKDIDKLHLRGKRNILRFYKEINFISKRKKQKLEFIILSYKKETSLTDFVPFISDFIRNLNNSRFIIGNNFDRYPNMEKNYKQINSILLEKTDIDYTPLFEYFLTYNYLFDYITKIENSGLQKVYSIKVESNCHSFISNGFISHNTEAKLEKLGEELLKDIEKNTVKFIPNFDGSLKEPIVLPSKIPNLLVNGSSGIAVGMATNMPPHNIQEVIDAIINLINNPEITIEELMNFIKGPDFPTGAFICGLDGIKQAYKTGRGKLILKAKTEIEKNKILITEIPYMVNKTNLIEEIASLVRDKKIEGITDLRDESDRAGMRIVLDLKQNSNPDVILNQLFKYSQLKTTFGIINIALVDGTPKLLNLKELLSHFLQHRKEIITNRSKFDLAKAQARSHILEGLKIALESIDSIIKTIKSSPSPKEAKLLLIDNFTLTELQSQAILDMKLQSLTSLETNKINSEHQNLLKIIQELEKILSSDSEIYNLIKQELKEIKNDFADKRKTEITSEYINLDKKDLIPDENVVITFTKTGYVKRLPLVTYKTQKRGGKGIKGTDTKEKDIVENLFTSSTHDDILCFTNFGRLYCLKAYNIPEASRYSAGKAIVNLLHLKNNEKVTTMIPIKDYSKDYLVMVTKLGLIKKTALKFFSKPRKTGIICMNLHKEDELIKVLQTDGTKKLILATNNGMAIKFNEKDVKSTGRSASGIRAIRLKNDSVISIDIANDSDTLITATETGFGKRSKISNYRLIKRGGVGVINIKPVHGKVVGAKTVNNEDEILFITEKGIVMRTKVKNLSTIGRNTSGLRLIKLNENDKLVSIAKIIENNL